MADQPSYRTSTLSQLVIVALGTFAIGLVFLTIGVIWFKLELTTAKELFLMYLVLVNGIVNPYLATRPVSKNGNGGSHEAPPVVPTNPQ